MKDSTKNSKPIAPASTAPSVSSSAKARVAMPEKGVLWKKKNTAAGDPTRMAKPSRTFTMVERAGARYGVKVGFQKQVAPEAGLTQSNGRIVPSAVNRSRPNFNAGMTE